MLTEVAVPHQLLDDGELTDSARVLWCYLRAIRKQKTRLTWAELRRVTGLSQYRLKQHMRALDALRWIQLDSLGTREFECCALWRGTRAFTIPVDLVLDRRIPHGAKWLWAHIRGVGEFDYAQLQHVMRCSRISLRKYVRILSHYGWLVGEVVRAGRCKVYRFETVNIIEENRHADVQDFYEGLRLARLKERYSVGQYLLKCIVAVLVVDQLLIENGEVLRLVNPFTGGQLHYDLLLPVSRVALEFQGPQHYRTTQRYPSDTQLQEQRMRDDIKRRFSETHGITLIEVRADDLSFGTISSLLRRHNVPIRHSLDDQQHLCDAIEAEAANYRRWAQRLERRLSSG